MSPHLVESGLFLFKCLRQLQLNACCEGGLTLADLSNEVLLIHDLIACFWIAMKHCSVRTQVPNRYAGACQGATVQGSKATARLLRTTVARVKYAMPAQRPTQTCRKPSHLPIARARALNWVFRGARRWSADLRAVPSSAPRPPPRQNIQGTPLPLLPCRCRTLVSKATGAEPDMLGRRELEALILLDWDVNTLLRFGGLVA